ncbi:MAG: phosphatase PAP2 family protein [Flavobacteriales bacterium]|nr:phosphatase PAP2 family protein [Flavobacteriales bacterium]
MKIASQIISWLFVPLFTPVLGMMLVMFVPSHQDILNEDSLYALIDAQKWQVLYHYFFFCMVVPGLSLLYLRSIGVVSTIEVDNRRERSIPILVMFASCLGLYLLHIFMIPAEIEIPKFIFSYPLAGAIVTVIFFFQTLWKKVSLHAGGMGIMSGFIIAYVAEMQSFEMWIVVFAIITSGLVMSARVYLEKHTLLEVVIGWFTGTFVTFAVNYYY